MGPKFDQNPMCGRRDMKEIKGSLILTRLSWILCIDFRMNDPSPFYRVYGNISGSRTSQFRPPRDLDRLLESIPPLTFTFPKLVPVISPPLLNRFLRFPRRCNLLMTTSPTLYNFTLNPNRISNHQ